MLLGFCEVFSLAIEDLIYTQCEKVGILWIKTGFPWFCFYLILNKHEKRQKLIDKVDTNYFSPHWISTALKPFRQTPAINLKSVKLAAHKITHLAMLGNAKLIEKKKDFMKFWQWRHFFFLFNILMKEFWNGLKSMLSGKRLSQSHRPGIQKGIYIHFINEWAIKIANAHGKWDLSNNWGRWNPFKSCSHFIVSSFCVRFRD